MHLIESQSSIQLADNNTIASSYQYLGCYGDSFKKRAMTKKIGTVKSIFECYVLAGKNKFSYFGLQWFGECWVSNNLTRTESLYGICGQCAANGCETPKCTCSKTLCANGDNCGDAGANALYAVTSLDAVNYNPPSMSPVVAKASGIPSVKPTAGTSSPSVSYVPTNKVVSTIAPTNEITYRYLGCYGDSLALRSMTRYLAIVPSMLDCYQLAIKLGFTVYGLQAGGQCTVSNNLALAEKYGQCGTPGLTGSNLKCDCSKKKCKSGEDCGDSQANKLYLITSINATSPTRSPTFAPSTFEPTFEPTQTPTFKPSQEPSFVPSFTPSFQPTTSKPSKLPTRFSQKPTTKPFAPPSKTPVTSSPSKQPVTFKPSKSAKPTFPVPTQKPKVSKPTKAPK